VLDDINAQNEGVIQGSSAITPSSSRFEDTLTTNGAANGEQLGQVVESAGQASQHKEMTSLPVIAIWAHALYQVKDQRRRSARLVGMSPNEARGLQHHAQDSTARSDSSLPA
jgi:hypothetical protein